MQMLGMVLPVLPGKTDEAMGMSKEINSRMKEHDEAHRGSTMHRDTLWLQHTPMGDLLVDVIQADDMQKAFMHFITSKNPYMVWAKQKMQAITGIDWNQPPPGMPEQVMDWNIGEGKASLAFAFPILPGKTEAAKTFFKEALGPRRKEQDESRKSKGLTKELAWVNPTPMGDILVVYLEGDDPVKGNQMFAESKSPYDVWFKQQAQIISGIDLNQPLPGLPEMVFDYRAT